MTQEEILEGNKLIAIFDGYVIDNTYPDTDRTYNKNGNIELDTTFKHHSDWNWLMPIVEKIESIKNSDDYEVDIFGKCCDIGGNFEAVGETKIDATFKEVVEFIKWYNQNK